MKIRNVLLFLVSVPSFVAAQSTNYVYDTTSTATNTNINTSISTSTATNNNNNVSTSTNTNINTSTSTNYNENVSTSTNVNTSTNTNYNENVSTSTSKGENTNYNFGDMTNRNISTVDSTNRNITTETSTQNVTSNVNQVVNQNSTATNVNQNNNVNVSDSKSYSESINRQVIDQNIKSPPPSAIAPSMMSYSQDLCTTGMSGAVQTQIFGISAGKAVRDENCERIKLSSKLFDMGMKVAAVSLLCQDKRVFQAMEMAGTPCPYYGRIGAEATNAWSENPKARPDVKKK